MNTSPSCTQSVPLRLAGYETASTRAGVLVDQDLVVSGGFLEEEGYQAADGL